MTKKDLIARKPGFHKIGQFEMTSGIAIVSDPCYELGTWCQAKIKNVKRGKWNAYIEFKKKPLLGTCVTEVFAVHEDFKHEDIDINDWKPSPLRVGMDTAKAGIFDLDHYRNDTDADGHKYKKRKVISGKGPGGEWRSMCCDITEYGIVPGGCLACSGADGEYGFYTLTKKKSIVGIAIAF